MSNGTGLKQSHDNQKLNWIFCILASAAAALLAGAFIICDLYIIRPDVLESDIVGRYSGGYGSGNVVLTIRQGGEFAQEVKEYGQIVYSNRGRWQVFRNTIELTNYLVCRPASDEGTHCHATVTANIYLRGKTIDFGEEREVLNRID